MQRAENEKVVALEAQRAEHESHMEAELLKSQEAVQVASSMLISKHKDELAILQEQKEEEESRMCEIQQLQEIEKNRALDVVEHLSQKLTKSKRHTEIYLIYRSKMSLTCPQNLTSKRRSKSTVPN